MKNLIDENDTNRVADQAVSQLARPFNLDGRDTLITASIGISNYPADGTDADLLLKKADTAMYQGKERGRNNFQHYSVELEEAAAARTQLQLDLNRAIHDGEFELFYQPQVSLDNGRITGVEALLRWRHPQRGMLDAVDFIGAAQETGLIVQIGQWAFESACRQVVQWHRAGPADLHVTVNVSPVEMRSGRIVGQVRNALLQSGLAPQYLEIELTEGMNAEDNEAFIRTLVELKELGISIALDDFGTGYASLDALRSFPIDKIKVDQTFIRDIARNTRDSAIVQAVVAMAHQLQLKVVAKGVETEVQAAFLRRCRCDAAQGFLFGAPMDPRALGALLNRPIAGQPGASARIQLPEPAG